jgi:tetratricopeptide (TPR) repeat protein
MDPMMRAMQQLTAEAEAFWRAHPGQVLPLVAGEEQRADVVAALRLREAAPDNRRPIVVFEAPFASADAYFAALAEHVAAHYERVRAGAAEEGVALPAFDSDDGMVPSGALERAALAVDRAARLLGEGFDGLVVALVPEHVADAGAWRSCVQVLAAVRWSRRARIAVLSPPAGPLADILVCEGAHLVVDAGALLAFMRQLDPNAGGGVATGGAVGVGTQIRLLLLDAAAALGRGRPDQAAEAYRAARALCQAEGLVEQEVGVLVALGGACMSAGAPELGADSYRQAAVLAERAEAWPLACQAWLGVGGAFLPRGDHAPAVAAYRAAAAAAKRGEVESVAVRIEALRMVGTCLLRLDREDEAMLAWKEAVDVGASAAERGATSFEEVGRALAKLLDRRGLASQAAHVRGIIDGRGGRGLEGAGLGRASQPQP